MKQTMTVKTAPMIYDEMIAHIRSEGSRASAWYAGITRDIQARLFGDHNVPRENHWFIYRRASSEQSARSIERALLEYGCDGGPSGGGASCIFVYAYRKAAITAP